MSENQPEKRLLNAWLSMLTPWVDALPAASRPDAMKMVREQLVSELQALDFDIDLIGSGAAPVIVARRSGQGPHTLGLAAHYDVEEIGEGWSLPSSQLTTQSGRVYGRGLADNLGPLALRLVTLHQRTQPTPPLVWVIQGEEEVGSSLAHATYPDLAVDDVALWLEETGYFEADGSQRLLATCLDDFGKAMRDAVTAVATADGRAVQVHDRHLNKAFGQNRCPFLVHLAAGRPYLAMGPNDPDSNIHAADESLPFNTLDISARQFNALLSAAVA
jgi:acetylornithine deacetylase/succinyl-diaminopimelate desuccinylase-like protein